MRVLVADRNTYQLTTRKITDEGYLSAPARVARTGIQQYLASELGLTDRKPNDIINVYRPPEEVFATDSLATYLYKEVTDNHPPEMVSAETYKKYSVGQVVSAGTQDGDFVQVDLLVKDSQSISSVFSGKVELSAGYYADYVPEQGTAPSGESYEFVQRNIVINHVALVDKARAGHGAKIFDQTGDKRMPIKVTLDNGRTVELEENTAALVEDSLKRVTDRADKAEQQLKTKDAEVEKEKARADQAEEELEKEKEKTSDSAIEQMVADRLTVIDTARRLVPKIETTGKTIDGIKREVVAALHPKQDFKDRDMAYINARFEMDAEEKENEDEDEEKEKQKATDSHRKLANDMASGTDKSTVTDARALNRQRISNAWKAEA